MATTTAGPDPILAASVRTPHVPATRLVLGLPIPAAILAVALLAVGVMAAGYVLAVPFDTAAFGGLTVPTVVLSGVADGFNPCAFALLVLFATYTLTLVNAVTSDGTPTVEARRRLLGAGSLYVGACGSPTSSSAWAFSPSSAGWGAITSSPGRPRSWPSSWPLDAQGRPAPGGAPR